VKKTLEKVFLWEINANRDCMKNSDVTFAASSISGMCLQCGSKNDELKKFDKAYSQNVGKQYYHDFFLKTNGFVFNEDARKTSTYYF